MPLNFLFNILVRCLPSETIALILREFGLNTEAENQFRLEYPWSSLFTQPDIRIESPHDRIFVEIKLGEPIKRAQVQKYLLLHALMDTLHGAKSSYLLFLSKEAFSKCWRPSPEGSVCADVQSFLERQTADDDVPEKLARKLPKADAKATLARYQIIKREIVYGATTWASVGECLAKVRTSVGYVERGLIDDFIRDLSVRELVGLKA